MKIFKPGLWRLLSGIIHTDKVVRTNKYLVVGSDADRDSTAQVIQAVGSGSGNAKIDVCDVAGSNRRAVGVELEDSQNRGKLYAYDFGGGGYMPLNLEGSEIQFNGSKQVHTKVVSIGAWNMDTTDSVSVAHGLTLADIIGYTGWILPDNPGIRYPIPWYDGVGSIADVYFSSESSSYIVINRLPGGAFDNTSYDDGAMNRGYLLIFHN